MDGNDITYAKPHRRARVGMSRTFQRLETFGTLSVRDNVLVAAEMRRGWSRDKFDPAAVTDEVIERIGLGDVAAERVDTLPTGTARSRRGGARARRRSRGCSCSTSRRRVSTRARPNELGALLARHSPPTASRCSSSNTTWAS